MCASYYHRHGYNFACPDSAVSEKFWSGVEAMPRKDLINLQEKLFLNQIKHSAKSSSWYRNFWNENGVDINKIKNLSDIIKLPFVTKKDIRDSQKSNAPYGMMLVDNIKREDIVRVAMTSGTTGTPVLLPFPKIDYELWMQGVVRALWSAGVRKNDVVHAAFGFTPFIGLFGAHDAAERYIEATVIPGGAWDSSIRISMLPLFGVTVLLGTPSYLLRLGRLAVEQGHDLSKWPIRTLFVTGEMGPNSSPATGQRLSELWHADVHEFCGAQEVNYFAWSCPHGGFHWNEDLVYPEVLDPETMEPVSDGEPGILVVTDLRQQSHPLIRYPTGDLVQGLEVRPCGCGRTLKHFKGFVGRIDDVIKIRGVSIAQSGIEHILRSNKQVSDDYDIEFYTDKHGMDSVRIRVEPKQFLNKSEVICLEDNLKEKLKQTMMITMQVNVVEQGTIPRFELKAKRIVDNRKK